MMIAGSSVWCIEIIINVRNAFLKTPFYMQWYPSIQCIMGWWFLPMRSLARFSSISFGEHRPFVNTELLANCNRQSFKNFNQQKSLLNTKIFFKETYNSYRLDGSGVHFLRLILRIFSFIIDHNGVKILLYWYKYTIKL